MSEEDRPDTPPAPLTRGQAATLDPDEQGAVLRPLFPPPPGRRVRLKWLRLLAIFLLVLLLGAVSFVFGMFMSVAAELPELEKAVRAPQFQNPSNSILLDDQGHEIGVLSEQNQYLVTKNQIPPIVKNAVISIEDKRFRENSGIDLRAVARAFFNDILGTGGTQGASTIEEQFVKLALEGQSHRTIFEKLREAALAYHISQRWSKEKILTDYLNTVYFGNGAYGIESAARTYFTQEGCGTPKNLCVEHLRPWQAALLAGMIQSPTDYNPIEFPRAAERRRNVVLEQMYQQGYITHSVFLEGIAQPVPKATSIEVPQEIAVGPLDVGYFNSWVSQEVVERYGKAMAYDGGLKIKTTLDPALQRAAEESIHNWLPEPGDPSAALVAIENSTGKVRAMVGGSNYEESQFNLATMGQRQPGSAFKVFDLAAALEDGISPESVWSSKPKVFNVPNSKNEKFYVHNDEGVYVGERTLTNALAFSDNSVFAEVGLKVGTSKIAHIAHEMGITTPISTNPSMTIGGLKEGVTPIDMAHAYETLAESGERIGGTLAPSEQPDGIEWIKAPEHKTLPDGRQMIRDDVHKRRVLQPTPAQEETTMLETVLQYGTAKESALGEFAAGKTGTTSNYVDAWFVGYNSKYTVSVWVGYPNKLVEMKTQWGGGPVLGGTFPAHIWHDFMVAAMQIQADRAAGHSGSEVIAGAAPPVSSETPISTEEPSSETAPATGTSHTTATPRAGTEAQPKEAGETEPTTTGATPGATQTPETTPTPTEPTPTEPAPGVETGEGGGANTPAGGTVAPPATTSYHRLMVR